MVVVVVLRKSLVWGCGDVDVDVAGGGNLGGIWHG